MKLKSSLLCAALLPLSLSALASEAPATVNPLVVAKAAAMGKHLRSLQKFAVNAQVTHDVVQESGQKIQAAGTSQMVAMGANQLYVNVDTDHLTREYFFNGKKLTQYSPNLKYYTTVDAASNTLEMLNSVEKYYGLNIPLKALYQLGSDEADMSQLTLAAYVGTSKINNQLCDQLAFSQPGMDWQLWVSRGEKPLPCKLVVTKTSEASQPQYSETFAWNLSPTVKTAEFTFKPGKGDVAIPFKKIAE